MIRRKTKPLPDIPSINKSAVPKKKRSKPKELFGEKYGRDNERIIRGKDGYLWKDSNITGNNEQTALKQAKFLLKGLKKEIKVVRDGDLYRVLIRVTERVFKDKSGYIWIDDDIVSYDERSAYGLADKLSKDHKKETKVVRYGNVYRVLVRRD